MTRDEQLKILKSPKASKAQLRGALAASLGVPYEIPVKEKSISLFTQCKGVFMDAYNDQTKIEYSFTSKDGIALSALIGKLKGIIQFPTDPAIVATFRLLLLKMPDWYKTNAFSLTVINSKFNEIVASISKNGGKQGITDDYKARVLNDLTT